MDLKILVLTISDRASTGEYEDVSGQLLMKEITQNVNSKGHTVEIEKHIVPDEKKSIENYLNHYKRYNAIFTTGGTGIAKRDITPDVVKPYLTKEIPGIMESIRLKYGIDKPLALLSRSIAGVIGINTLIYTLPGSKKAIAEYCNEIFKTFWHSLELLTDKPDIH